MITLVSVAVAAVGLGFGWQLGGDLVKWFRK